MEKINNLKRFLIFGKLILTAMAESDVSFIRPHEGGGKPTSAKLVELTSLEEFDQLEGYEFTTAYPPYNFDFQGAVACYSSLRAPYYVAPWGFGDCAPFGEEVADAQFLEKWLKIDRLSAKFRGVDADISSAAHPIAHAVTSRTTGGAKWRISIATTAGLNGFGQPIEPSSLGGGIPDYIWTKSFDSDWGCTDHFIPIQVYEKKLYIDEDYLCEKREFQPFVKQKTWNPTTEGSAAWSMTINLSEDDGMVISDLKLGSRLVATKMSVPYFKLHTEKLGKLTRGELKRKSEGGPDEFRSRIIFHEITEESDRLRVRTDYEIDKFPVAGDRENLRRSLIISQNYEFLNLEASAGFEPTGKLGAQVVRPVVRYWFQNTTQYEDYDPSTALLVAEPADVLKEVIIPLRIEFALDDKEHNTTGLFKDNSFFGLIGLQRAVSNYDSDPPAFNGLNREIYEVVYEVGGSNVDLT